MEKHGETRGCMRLRETSKRLQVLGPWQVGPAQGCDPLPFFDVVQNAGYPAEVGIYPVNAGDFCRFCNLN